MGVDGQRWTTKPLPKTVTSIAKITALINFALSIRWEGYRVLAPNNPVVTGARKTCGILNPDPAALTRSGRFRILFIFAIVPGLYKPLLAIRAPGTPMAPGNPNPAPPRAAEPPPTSCIKACLSAVPEFGILLGKTLCPDLPKSCKGILPLAKLNLSGDLSDFFIPERSWLGMKTPSLVAAEAVAFLTPRIFLCAKLADFNNSPNLPDVRAAISFIAAEVSIRACPSSSSVFKILNPRSRNVFCTSPQARPGMPLALLRLN